MHKIEPTPDDIKYVEEKATLGMEDQDIYYGLGWDHSLFYTIINRHAEFSAAHKRGKAQYRDEMLTVLRARQEDPEMSATYLALNINREARIRGKYPNYSELTKDVLTNPNSTPQQMIFSIVADHAEGRITKNMLNNAVDAITKLAQVVNRDELDELTKSVKRLEEIVKQNE